MSVEPKPARKTGKKRLGICLLIGCGGILLLALAAAGVYLWAGWQGYQEAPKRVEGVQPETHLEDPYSLSPEQTDLLFSSGYPEAFTLLFYQEESPNGSLAGCPARVLGVLYPRGELHLHQRRTDR